MKALIIERPDGTTSVVLFDKRDYKEAEDYMNTIHHSGFESCRGVKCKLVPARKNGKGGGEDIPLEVIMQVMLRGPIEEKETMSLDEILELL